MGAVPADDRGPVSILIKQGRCSLKALVLEDFNKLAVQEIGTPQPGRGEILLRVSATGICGSDIHGFTGENGRRFPGQIMGHESAGHIEALGAGVSNRDYPVGRAATFNPVIIPDQALEEYAGREQHYADKVVVGVSPHYNAAFAEYLLLPARNVVLLREDFPVHLGALIEPLAVGLHAVRRAGVNAERKVLVLGGGPIGQSIVLALKAEGVTDIAVSEVDSRRRELCTELSAFGIDPGDADLPESVAAVFGGPADLTFDAVGITATVNDALRATLPGGTVVLVGMGSPRVDLSAFLVSTEERELIGSFTYSAQDFVDAARWAESHAEWLEKLVSMTVGPHEAEAAFKALAAGGSYPGKVLVGFEPAG